MEIFLPLSPLNTRITVKVTFITSSVTSGEAFTLKILGIFIRRVSDLLTLTNYFGHLGRTSMAVKSVAVRNAQNYLVVRSVQWASSRTITVVLSASAEVGVERITSLCLFSKQLKARRN